MWNSNLYLVLCLITPSLAIWQCSTDEDCGALTGSVCAAGLCGCTSSQQVVAGGTLCADYAPYYTSACVDDFQCSRLFTTFECRRNEDQTVGSCLCQPGHHYFHGRCWRSTEMGQPCTNNEECMGVIRDPYSMVCDGTCQCAEGYYSKQRGECRKIATAVGEGCVLNEDCQFENGACRAFEFVCYDRTVVDPEEETSKQATQARQNSTLKMADTPSSNMAATVMASKMVATKMPRNGGAVCSAASPCAAPFECASWGHCICPIGYYGSEDGSTCLAELGSPSSEEQCVGLLAVVEDGICTCPPNFFFDENMRDCVKVARIITDSCIFDEQCHTFGAAAFCGAPGQWGLRSCECDLEQAVWDAQRGMCRLFAGLGETCQVDSDCMAGELEIQCALNEEGEGYCACPDGLIASEGLCLSSGLELGDSCQRTEECTGTVNTVCETGRCSCDNGYQELDDFCAPIIGGTCSAVTDCVISNTTCVSGDGGMTCQCTEEFVEYNDECWEVSNGYEANCTVAAQCYGSLGANAVCQEGSCLCAPNFHFQDGGCWPVTGLFETCSRSSQCFLGELTDRVVCRNGLCQCDFNYPYSEELHTCRSSATILTSSCMILITTLAYLFS
ncbi:prion-like-(Q/N-rich) domain-bearing protein 25 [Leguminivora glycinivorella]|uniref:prion-like-(Q/N-rich) domain-bearing protein 25 n=1 Tax=Leguminivora glycinivorella TaxID=1035111 RepID=UPI00200D3132|nr:prion-like-(Q/N-rich) domain-bearing protein 25 [Leguminivora glycinivorella]